MGLWTKGIKRSQTGKLRLEDGDIYRWMDEICVEIKTFCKTTCDWMSQITPFGHMFIIKFEQYVMSFNVDHTMSKLHLISNIKQGIQNLLKKSNDRNTDLLLNVYRGLIWIGEDTLP